jgi:hypothetical protein
MLDKRMRNGSFHSPRRFLSKYEAFLLQAIAAPGIEIYVGAENTIHGAKHRQVHITYLIQCIRHFPGHWPTIGAVVEDWDFRTRKREAEDRAVFKIESTTITEPAWQIFITAQPRVDYSGMLGKALGK